MASDWLIVSPKRGSGNGSVTVYSTGSSVPYEREARYKLFNSTSSINVTVKRQGKIPPDYYITCYYDVVGGADNPIIGNIGWSISGDFVIGINVDNGLWERPTTTYYFSNSGRHKVEIATVNSETGDGLMQTSFNTGLSNTLKEAIIPYGYTTVNHACFSGCGALETVSLPDGLTEIGDYAFENCRSLTNITIPDSVTTIGAGLFLDCRNITAITLSTGITNIGSATFFECQSLPSITIPAGVTTIGTSGGSAVFYNCLSLRNIYCYPTTAPTTYSRHFRGISSTGTLHYPSGSDYSSWINFLPAGWTFVADL